MLSKDKIFCIEKPKGKNSCAVGGDAILQKIYDSTAFW